MLSDEVRKEVNSLLLNNLTPSQTYNEFLLNLKIDCQDDLNFHLQKADRSECPRRRDFNPLYIKYCQEHFGRIMNLNYQISQANRVFLSKSGGVGGVFPPPDENYFAGTNFCRY